MAFFQFVFNSKALEEPAHVNMIIPDQCEKDIPVVYLLHGLFGDQNSWIRYTSIERYANDRGLAIVMPYAADSFYSGYVAWAVEKGITNGLTENLFGPAESINRAQMVTFLYRYAVSEGMDVTVADADALLARFPDGETLPEWAKAPFAWAIENGIINGMDGKLAPGALTNRAQVAVMLYRFFFEA